MKCPNCNAEINEGSIICPNCNTQFAFTANDNFINLPDDDYVIKSNGVEEYVDPHSHDSSPVVQEKGVLNLKSNPTPKKVVKRVVKVNTQQVKPVEEEAVEIKPSVNIDMNDEVIEEKPVDMETTVVNVGGFTNTIIDATSAEKPKEESTPTPQSDLVAPPVTVSDPGVFAPTTNQATGVQMISNVDIQTNTIGQVSVVEENKEKKPKKKMSETMLLALVMGLIVILLCFIVYILLQNKESKDNTPTTTTQMTTFNCDNGQCETTTTTTTESTTTTTRPKNKGLKSTVDIPLSIGQTSLCDIYESGKSYKVDVTLNKIFSPTEAQEYMKNYNNTTYEEGMSVGVLQYTLRATEIDDGIELNPLTSIEFYPVSVSNKFSFNGKTYTVGFVGDSNELLTNQKEVTVTGYYNYPSDQPIGVVCIGDYDGQKGCFKLN
jgi:hypothetical protein